jgi:hypothetical protein
MKISPGKTEKLRRQQDNQRELTIELGRSDSTTSSRVCEGAPGEIRESESGETHENEPGAVREGDF